MGESCKLEITDSRVPIPLNRKLSLFFEIGWQAMDVPGEHLSGRRHSCTATYTRGGKRSLCRLLIVCNVNVIDYNVELKCMNVQLRLQCHTPVEVRLASYPGLAKSLGTRLRSDMQCMT